jgi:general secretion pathway protein E
MAKPAEAPVKTGFENAVVESWSDAGTFAVGPDAQHLLCLLADGRLLIAAGQELHPTVQSYIARLERARRSFRRCVIDSAVVRSMYLRRPTSATSVEQTPMQQLAKEMLHLGCESRASDIHIRVDKDSTEVFFRIHNDLVHRDTYTREFGQRMLATLYAAMTDVSDASYKPNERQDARIGDPQKLPERLHGVRIATTPTVGGSLMVLRLLYDDTSASYDPCTLGYSQQHGLQIQAMKDKPIGMNIISGPTGSGKSTTLQRILSGLIQEREQKLHVITVEDPPEYPIEGAVQTPVTNTVDEGERSLAFSRAISNAMRLDPDTIMIGEMRDLPSAQLCLRAAMTGHQVWTTVHANSAMGIVDRLIDLGLPMPMVADPEIVTGLIGQRLVKVLCPHCKIALKHNMHELPLSVLGRVKAALRDHFDSVHIVGAGCKHCGNHGTVGRTVVAEIITPDAEFFGLIRRGDKVKAHEYWIAQGGMTAHQHVLTKIVAGEVDPRMAERVVGRLHAEADFEARLTPPDQPDTDRGATNGARP